MSLEKEMAQFLKSNKKRYHRFLEASMEKYKSLGSIGGSIYLDKLNDGERSLLCKIDSKYISLDEAKITVKKFLSVFKNTKYADADIIEVLKIYFNEELKPNREIKEEKQREKEEFFNLLLDEFKGTKAFDWLSYSLFNKTYGYNILIKQYEKNKEDFRIMLENVLKAVNYLNYDKSPKRLAIFASFISKDPHYFDEGKAAFTLLLSALSFLSNIIVPENSEEKSGLLYSFGILKDEISNFTVCASIKAFTMDGEHIGIKGFCDMVEPLQLNLWNLSNIKDIICKDNILYVFENPSVFSEVLERTKSIKPSLLCTSGQLKLASLIFLDKASENVDKIYYSGDIDPEGIYIAYKLKQRYKDKLIYWRYDNKSYKKMKSKIKFDDRRKKQIEGIEDKELKNLIDEVLKEGCCGYQELIIDKYVEDIFGDRVF
ncbi:TIGR02679 family protein [Caloramator quimbayensis]|uniref:TIGR02679 family protein n=1 Tax=Caloramator quimbayensis TaxID=1147123 RepID=A0A1T4YAR7_9CLOT|nr:TIGR02679 domain-containing protein [Caloramator quimbayensis]SKA98894.1 TIGR02679 family protein [Caloramator quimbayensis]